MSEYLIGTSGWHYEHWRDNFYPDNLPKSKWLNFYSQTFITVELNNSFYHLPSENAFKIWKQLVPDNFLFSVKVSRFITHIKKLKNLENSLDNFINRAKILEYKLGPLLYQLPPQLKRDDDTLKEFLNILPANYKHVFEFRHESWNNDKVFELLQEYKAGFCIYDKPDFTTPIVSTTDFAYIRFHGSTGLYWSSYSDRELKRWANKIVNLGKNVKIIYIYFNNDAGGYAIKNATKLKSML